MIQHFGPGIPSKPTHNPVSIAIDADLVRQARRVTGKLNAKGQSLVIAESSCAGFIASALGQTEGVGEILLRKFVTPTKERMVAELGVSSRLLAQNTSAAVVEAMAKGALARSAATIALAVRVDVAPMSYEVGNRVGLVYFCCRNRFGQSLCIGKDFSDDTHEEPMRSVVVTALTILEDFARKAG